MDFSEVFKPASDESNECLLVEPLYDFSTIEFKINKPIHVKSVNRAKLLCERIIILANDVTFENIQFEGSFVVRDADSFSVINCELTNGNTGSGGSIVLTRSVLARIIDTKIHDSNTAGIFVETNSSAEISNVEITNIKGNAVCISDRCDAIISKCDFSKTKNTGIAISFDTNATIKETNIHDIEVLALNFNSSIITMVGCTIERVEQNGCNLNSCQQAKIFGNTFRETGSSAISITYKSTGTILGNKFENIHGNCVIMNDESVAVISDNIMDKLDYPSVAVLTQSTAEIRGNKISDCQKAGICVRNANQAHIINNSIKGVKDTGISVSDSKHVLISGNSIEDCIVAGIESYNESEVISESNTFINPGKTGLTCYAGAVLDASKNTFEKPIEALVLLSTHGGGKFLDNICKDVPAQYIGETTGLITMSGNADFEAITNDPECKIEGVKVLPPFHDPRAGKCLKCGLVDRAGFLSPCGHKIFCNECGVAAAEAKESCPLCRFPIQSFTQAFSNSLDDTCSICYESKADAIVLPCGHTGICTECIQDWLTRSNCCPVCRMEGVSFKKILSNF